MIKPILFNTQMVQEILESRKTTTRRIIKTGSDFNLIGICSKDGSKFDYASFGYGNIEDVSHVEIKDRVKAPYLPGDILYVRETWLAHSRGLNTLAFKYKADGTVNDIVSFTKERFNKFYKFADQEKWQPSLFMPKEAARIFLRVKNVKIERLQDITEDGIRAEGITEEFPPHARDKFQELWDSTTKEYRWRLNPWVWVIEFERCEKPNEI